MISPDVDLHLNTSALAGHACQIKKIRIGLNTLIVLPLNLWYQPDAYMVNDADARLRPHQNRRLDGL